MAPNENPGALAGATGAGLPCYAVAAGTYTLPPDAQRGNALAHRLAPFASLDSAALAALGLVAARLWGAMT